jgi:hypothetical protein
VDHRQQPRPHPRPALVLTEFENDHDALDTLTETAIEGSPFDSWRQIRGASDLGGVLGRRGVHRARRRARRAVVHQVGGDVARVLNREPTLRPRLFMASMLPADYEGTDLEERQVMARWGGQVVLVPLVDGRSTSRLIDSAAAAGA